MNIGDSSISKNIVYLCAPPQVNIEKSFTGGVFRSPAGEHRSVLTGRESGEVLTLFLVVNF